MSLPIGTPAPDFVLPATNGQKIRLSEQLSGKPCILYFYPKDFTGVCTKEACGFRDHFEVFKELDIDVLGISRDSLETHLKFKEQYSLPFELLTDSSGKVCKDYDALIPILGLPKRVTYLLNNEHVIVSVFEDLFRAHGHIEKMVSEVTKKSLTRK